MSSETAAVGEDVGDGLADTAEERVKQQRKQPVLLHLWEQKRNADCKIVTSADVKAAIEAIGSSLGTANPANFLKDIVRRKNASELWPAELTHLRMGARQRFGQKRVFEFVPFADDADIAFPDRFEPSEQTPTYPIQSISLPHVARRLGRAEETWLAQVVVNLRVVESHLAFESAWAERLKDVVHLQIGMKTQPEIDATFIATVANKRDLAVEDHVLITCEAKRKDERLLEDQLRFQVHQGMKSTAALKNPVLSGVKPIALKLVERPSGTGVERLIYVVEFKTIERDDYENRFKPTPGVKGRPQDDTPVYSIPLVAQSRAFFQLHPGVRGVSS